MILTGTSGGDTGGRSVFFALDAKTGKVLWRWNAIPASKGDLGFETWAPPNERAWLGGGSLWSTPVVDPKLGFVYVSVGNPIPYVLGRPPGAEVPTNSIVALRIKTGQPVWQYQTIHHDIWDWDMSNSGMLMDLEYQGRLRNALIAVNKNGYAYVIDRSNGQPILPIPEVQQPQSKGANTWPTQPVPEGGAAEFIRHTIDAAPWQGYIGPDGKPPYLASDTQYPPIDDTRYTVHVEPRLNQWQHNSYDARLGLFFNQVSRSIVIRKAIPAPEVLSNLKFGNGVFGGRTAAPTAQTPAATATTIRLVAFRPAKNEIAWVTEYENNATTLDALGNFTGMVTTESGVLFAGRLNGYIEAYDSSNGKLLWRSDRLAARTVGAPMVFAVNGKESIGFFTGLATNVPGQTGNGSELYAFQLP
jgi:glucose dehydrogenase